MFFCIQFNKNPTLSPYSRYTVSPSINVKLFLKKQVNILLDIPS